jgi:RNA polymerase sigma factor (sigma-70 family)
MQDDTLLTQYARDGSEAAFSQLIARHMTLVYRTCLRETGSQSQAEDAAQVVFLLLARKAKTLRTGPSLAGWLYQTSRFVAKDVRKQEARRKLREEAVMQEIAHDQAAPVPEWESIEPLLNNALSSLKSADREAVLLRFLEGYNLAETGIALNISEDAARMRVTRAVEKLRRYLTAHGAAVTGLILTGLLTSEAAHPVPAHAAATITQGTLQAISTGPTANVLLLSKGIYHTMKIAQLKIAALIATTLLVGISVPLLAHTFSPHKANIRVLAPPAPLPVNVTTPFALDEDQHAFYSVTLPKGVSTIIIDERSIPGTMAYSVTLADRNASSLPGAVPASVGMNAASSKSPYGTEFREVGWNSLKNPKPVILDIHNVGVHCGFWLTILSPKPNVDASVSQASPALGVPLFGDVVPKPMALAVPQTGWLEQNQAGRLEKNVAAYFVIALKAGHYQSTLKFRDAIGKQTEMNGDLELDDEKGFPLFNDGTALAKNTFMDINELHDYSPSVKKFTIKQDGVFLVTILNQEDKFDNSEPVDFTEQIVPDDSPVPAARQN